MKNKLKNMDPTLMDLIAGCLIYGIIGEIFIFTVIVFLYEGNIWKVAFGFLTGIILMILMAVHMFVSLSTAMDLGEAHAGRYMIKKFVIRAVTILVIFFAIYFTDIINAIALVCGMISLKVAAYLQPITHKFITQKFNKGR